MQKGKPTASSVSGVSGINKPGSSSKIIRPSRPESRPSGLAAKSSKIIPAAVSPAPIQNNNALKATPAAHKGMSLGIKYAILTALTVSLAVILLVIISYRSSSKVIDENITEAGVRFVQGLATFKFSYWQSADKDTLELLASRKGNEIGLNVPSILNLVITDRELRPLAGIDQRVINLRSARELPPVTSENIRLLEGEYQEAITGKWVRTRLFIKKIVEPDLRSPGYVNLFLDARKIDEQLSDLLVSFILPAILSILIAGIIGFFMARWVTMPVKVLMEDMAIVSAGDLTHKSRVTSMDEVGVLASSFDKMTDSLKVAHQRELETKALEHELNIAREIQYNLLPKEIPTIPGYEIAARYFPCFEVSGDYYDIMQLDNDNLGIIVADVSGKGVPASMIMTMARSLIRMESERNLSSADTLKKVNRILARDLRRGMFVTAMYCILNIRTGMLKVSSAGHNPLVVWRNDQKRHELFNPNGIALGFDRGPVFDRTIKEESILMNPGDFVVSFTDGVTESMDENDEELGGDRFYKLVGDMHKLEPQRFIDAVMKHLEEYKGQAAQHDDITLVCIKRTGIAAPVAPPAALLNEPKPPAI